MAFPMADSAAKIMFFGSGLEIGGAELHATRLRAELAARGLASDLVLHGSARSEALLRTPGAQGARFLNIRGLSQLGGWLAVWRLFRRKKPEVIVAINQTPMIVAVVVRLLLGTRAKIVCIFHSTDMQDFERHLERLFKLAARSCDMLVYVSENQSRIWTARGVAPRAAEIIRNGVDAPDQPLGAAARKDLRHRFGIGDDDVLLGHVAAFREEKNHVELVDAVAAARARGLAVKALLVGDGPTLPLVQARVAATGMTDHVRFAGEQGDALSFMRACDVGVMCSTIETFPLAVLEFLACGVPVVSSDVGGVSEIVGSGSNGLLYRSGDIGDFVDCLAQMARPDRRAELAAQARPSVEGFSFSRMADRYEALIARLTARVPLRGGQAAAVE